MFNATETWDDHDALRDHLSALNAGPRGAPPKHGGPARLFLGLASRGETGAECRDSDSAKVAPILAKPRDVIQPRWGVYLLRRKAERLPFTVTGRTAEEAIERAIEEYDVPKRERFRISGQREA